MIIGHMAATKSERDARRMDRIKRSQIKTSGQQRAITACGKGYDKTMKLINSVI